MAKARARGGLGGSLLAHRSWRSCGAAERRLTLEHASLPPPSPHALQMERVAAWLLMSQSGRGGGLSVFQEASMAWEKRQAALRAQHAAAKARAAWAVGFEPAMGSVFQQSTRRAAEAAASASATAADGGGSAGNRARSAAAVATAARKWRDYQRARRKREQKMIATFSSASAASADTA